MKIFKGVLLLLSLVCCSSEMARLYDPHSLGTLTSSTLAWDTMKAGDLPPLNAVPIGNGGPLWCRSGQHAVWVAGAVIDGRCHAPFIGSIHIADQFQVLVSVNGSARLVNVPWDSSTALPSKPVMTPDMLLAVSADSEGGAVLPGYVDPKERRAHFLQGNEAVKLNGGLLVTEEEPVSYQLTDVRLSDKTKRSLHDEVLEEFVLENPTNGPTEVSREVTFISPHRTYFGRVKGTIVGLNASAEGPDTIPVNITWGLDNQLDRERSHTVIYNLPAGTSVNVRLIAVVRNLEGSYGGILTSLYQDSLELKRRISGLHTERRLAELKAEFSQTTFIADDGPVEELPPQSMVLLYSSTTTTSPATPVRKDFRAVSDSAENPYLPRPQQSVNSGKKSALISLALFFLTSALLLC